MAQPKKYDSPAQRQAAFRQRQAAAVKEALASKGLPPSAAIPSMPGTRRWSLLQQTATAHLQTLRDELEEYYSDRSESWQQGERGEEMQEKILALDSILSDLEALD